MSISVLMSVFKLDCPRYLRLTLDSLIEQTMQSAEIVLVQDGPLPFNLLCIIDEFKTKLNINSILLKENHGLGYALRHGLDFCRYPFVARVDSDDICYSERFF